MLKRPSMRDVARAAGVSVSAVSLVVNGKAGVSPQIRDHVWSVISDLGYKVSSSIGQETTPAVGLLIENTTMPVMFDAFYGEIMRGFQTEAQRMGYHVMLSMFDQTAENLEELQSTLADTVKGLVVANDGDISPDMIQQLEGLDMPIILIENYIPTHKISAVLGDNFMAGYTIMRHILELGHRSIAVLRGPNKYSSLVNRLRGILAAAGEVGMVIPPEWMPAPVSGHPHKGYVQMQEILALPNRPTAVIAISDKTAMGAMDAIRENRLSIPEDISVASIDDLAESAFTRPPLTTVHIPTYDMGVVAFQQLHRQILGESLIPTQNVVYSDLIVRGSCATLRK